MQIATLRKSAVHPVQHPRGQPGAPVRWAILGVLSHDQPRMVNEIAKIIGQSPGLVSKHLALLRGTGLVVVNRRLYQVPAAFIADAGKRHLDFVHCLLRLPDANGQPTRCNYFKHPAAGGR